MGPINYLAQMPQVDLLQNFGQGFQLGANIGTAGQEMEQRKLAIEQAQQYKVDVAGLMSAPAAEKPKLAAALRLKNPKYADEIGKAFGSLTEDEQKRELNDTWMLASTLHAERPDLAIKQIDERITAHKNSGMPISDLEILREWVEKDPTRAYGEVLHKVSALPGGDKILTNLGTLGKENREADLHPAAVREAGAKATGAEADAQTKAVTAKYADSQALADLEKKGWDIKSLQADIDYKKQSTRIAAMNAAYNREGNDLKRQELQQKIDTAKVELDNKLRDRADEARTQIDGAKAITTLIDEIFADNDSLEAATGASAWRAKIPGTKARTISGKIEQVSNTLALLNIDKLKGPTSDRDILFLKQIAANLDRYQDEDALKKDLGRVRDITANREKQLRQKYGVPATDGDPAIKPRTVVVDY